MPSPRRTLALVGNPNVGKSVLFHRLTGEYVNVSNYPGTTVEVARGRASLAGEIWDVVDTPGVNSLIPFSEDERVTRDFLLGAPDAALVVLDAKNLRRGLRLSFELADYGLPISVALNLMDEAMDRGIEVDVRRLSELLGVPVVGTVAVTGEGVAELKRAVAKASRLTPTALNREGLENALSTLEAFWPRERIGRRGLAAALLAGDETVPVPRDLSGLLEAAAALRRSFFRPPRQLMFEARESVVREIEAQVFSRKGEIRSGWAARWGAWSMRPWPGYLIAAGVLYLTYLFVGVFGAGVAVTFFENTVFGRFIVPAAARLMAGVPSPFWRDLMVGPYGVISMAISYAFALLLPIVTTFFIAFGFLEDSGYLPRLSVMVDRAFRLIGLNGRAVLPMILGLGCDTMATVTTRVLDTKRERVIVTFLLTLSIPCSAQLAVILAMTAGLSARVMFVWLAVLLGTTLAAGAAAARFVPGARSPFLMEIPPIRRPLLRNVFLKMRIRLAWYVKEVVPLFVLGTLVLFFLDRWGALRVLERIASPVVRGWLGLPGEATGAFLIGFLRRDYGAAGLYRLQKAGLLNLRQVTVSLVVVTLFMPCIAQWFIMVKERGLRSALGMTAIVGAVALGVSCAVNAGLNACPWILGR